MVKKKLIIKEEFAGYGVCADFLRSILWELNKGRDSGYGWELVNARKDNEKNEMEESKIENPKKVDEEIKDGEGTDGTATSVDEEKVEDNEPWSK